MNAVDQVRRSDAAILRSIWYGFLAAPVAYVAFAWFVARDMAPGAYPQSLSALVVAAAIGAVVLGRVLPARMLTSPRAAGTSTASAVRDRHRTALIVRWACFEAPAVLGLLLALLTGRFLPALAGSAIALILIQASRPDADRPPDGR